MACRVIDPGNPYVWIFTTALFLGFALAELTIVPKRALFPERARGRKWALVWIFLALSLGAATAGFFAAGWETFSDYKMLIYGAAAVAAAGLGFRFKKAAGIPMIMLIIIFIVYTGMVTSPFRCIQNAGEKFTLGTYRLLDDGPGGLRFELEKDNETVVNTLPAAPAAPYVSSLSIGEEYLFFGGSTLFLFHGLYKDENSLLDGGQKLDQFTGEAGVVSLRMIERFARLFPGIHWTLLSQRPEVPVLFQRYTVSVLKADGEITLNAEPAF